MLAQSDIDAGLCSLVHEMMETEKEHYRADRRKEVREPFEFIELVAPYPVHRRPTAPEFRKVRCRNISPSGLSYLDDAPPEQPRIVILLGREPFIGLTAEIVYHVPTNVTERAMYLIGCRFTGRFVGIDELSIDAL
jgi:hypothetical protein